MQKITAKVLILLLFLIMLGCTNSAKKADEQIGYTSNGTPIIDAQETYISWKATPSSTCFSKIGYDSNNEVLYVVFRDSGAEYRYTEFTYNDWESFNSASSLGSYYNSYIKGNYYCEKIAN